MRGRRPEPIPGVEPGRWRVRKARGTGNLVPRWYVDRDECHGSRWFPTWREAQDYADRMARTREYVPPRVLGSGEWVPDMPTLRLGWENHPTEKTFWVEDQGRGSITVRRDELLPLALALAALAEQEDSCGR